MSAPKDTSSAPTPTLTPGQGIPAPRLVLDADVPFDADPMAGAEIGECEVLCCLVPGSSRTLVACRFHETDASALVLLRRLDVTDATSASIREEAELAASLREPHLERVFPLVTSDDGVFWASEFVGGATVSEIRSVCKQKGISLPLGFALPAINDAARGLQTIHELKDPKNSTRHRAHGLLRPQNIVVTLPGPSKLLNPGYLRHLGGGSIDTEPLAGNAGYLSPEAIRGETLDSRSDVFALAVLAHEFLTNRTLFPGRSPKERADSTLKGTVPPPSRFNVSLGANVDEVILKALNPNPAARFANAAEFSQALRQAAAAFMWREAQRAEFMARLFPTRGQRAQLFQSKLKEREPAAKGRREAKRRREEEAKLAALARTTKVTAPRSSAASAPAAKPPPPPRGTVARPAVSRWVLIGGGVALLVAVAAFGWWMGRRASPLPPPTTAAPPLPETAKPAEAPAPPTATSPGAVAGAPDAGEPTVAPPAEGATAPAEGEPRKKKRKKKSDVPVPPWLR